MTAASFSFTRVIFLKSALQPADDHTTGWVLPLKCFVSAHPPTPRCVNTSIKAAVLSVLQPDHPTLAQENTLWLCAVTVVAQCYESAFSYESVFSYESAFSIMVPMMNYSRG